MVDREKFEAALRLFVVEVLQLAEVSREGRPFPARTRPHVVEPPGGGPFDVVEITETDASVLVAGAVMFERARALESMTNLVELAMTIPAIEKLVKGQLAAASQPDERDTFTLKHDMWMLARSVCSTEALAIDETRWRKKLDTFWLEVSDGKRWREVLAPVVGLSVVGSLELGDMVLRPFVDDERDFIASMVDSAYGFDQLVNGPHLARAVISHRALLAVGDGPERQPKVVMQDLVTALRLWTGAPLSIPLLKSGNSVTFGRMGGHNARSVALHEPSQFAKFWTETREAIASPPKGLDVALRRFGLMHDHPRSGDRVLDQMIILEALFMEEKQELSYRLTLRAARFAGDDAAARTRVMALLKKAYSLRSKVAHGDSLTEAEERLENDVDEAVREILKRYLKRAGAKRESNLKKLIIEELERGFLA